MTTLDSVLKSRDITLPKKVHLVKAMVFPVVMYGWESWTIELMKDWCWSWNSNTLATGCEELTPLKRPWCWERLKAGGEGNDRGWDGWMASLTQWTWVWANFGRYNKGQGSLVCCSPWGGKESDTTERLNWWGVQSSRTSPKLHYFLIGYPSFSLSNLYLHFLTKTFLLVYPVC